MPPNPPQPSTPNSQLRVTNSQPLAIKFQTFLQGQKSLSASSIKNYVSDINHFLQSLNSLKSEDLKSNSQTPTTASTASATTSPTAKSSPTASPITPAASSPISPPSPTVPPSAKSPLPPPSATASLPISPHTKSPPPTPAPPSAKSPLPPSTKSVQIKPNQITTKACLNYQDFLQRNVPPATANRRLSSLRKFTDFLVTTKLVSHHPTTQISRVKTTKIDHILDTFENYLKIQKLSASTIKNYLSDIKSYFLWAQKQSN